MARLALLIVGTACLIVAGCGGAGLPSDPGFADTAVRLTPSSAVSLTPPAVDDGLIPRWLDVADTAYTPAFQSSFDYADAQVSASWVTPAPQLVITLNGTGLKPNFAYQIKLEGLPALDPQGNQILASVGRSWEGLGYLIAGYFVTDAAGAITRTASSKWWPNTATPIDSSYHVLWKTSQRNPGPSDGPIITHQVLQTPGAYAVAEPTPGDTVEVYAEWEPDRPLPGELVLADRKYTCLLRLTEEAFHMTGSTGSLIYGWKTVLDAQMQFTIGPAAPPPPPPSGTGTIAGTVKYVSGAAARRVEVTLTDEATGAIVKRATTSGNGSYSLTDVPTDSTYTVRALTASQSGVRVYAGQTTTVNLIVP